jgi:hypothetical protein
MNFYVSSGIRTSDPGIQVAKTQAVECPTTETA